MYVSRRRVGQRRLPPREDPHTEPHVPAHAAPGNPSPITTCPIRRRGGVLLGCGDDAVEASVVGVVPYDALARWVQRSKQLVGVVGIGGVLVFVHE